MRFLAERIEEPRDIPTLGNVLFPCNADEPPQGLVSPEFGKRGLDVPMPQGDSQQNNTPGDMHRAIIASATSPLL
jgi:hypothetical protein